MTSQGTWILNGTFVTQNSQRQVIKGHLFIKDGVIEKIQKSSPRLKSGAKKIDASGKVVFPGFIQTHTHLCQTLFRNAADELELLDWLSKKIWKMEAAHSAQTLYVSALSGIYELLSSGTTCILDMATVRHTDAVFEAVKKSGIRANVGKCLMDHPDTTPPFLRESTENALNESIALFKRWHKKANDRIRVSYAPRFVVSCTERLLHDVNLLAKQQDALIHTHASENLKEIQLVKKMVGYENIEYLHQLGLTSDRLVLAHCIWLKPNEMEILENTRTNVTHCPSSNLKLASGLARVPEMRARNINVSLGADGAPCNNNLNQITEMRLAALIHKPGGGPKTLRAQEALDMATLHGAKALHWQDSIGSIECGKKADLTCFDLNQPENQVSDLGSKNHALSSESYASSLVYSSGPQHLQWTMVDGQVLFQKGKMKMMSTQKLIESINKAKASLKTRLKRIPSVRLSV